MPLLRHQPRLRGLASVDPCQAAADNASADTDAKMWAIGQAWRVKNFYKPADVQAYVHYTLQAIVGADQHYMQYVTSGFATAIGAIIGGDALTNTGLRAQYNKALPFLTAVKTAQDSGIHVIDAPDLKHWVLRSLAEVSAMYANTAFQACSQPWWVQALNGFYGVLADIAALVEAVVEAVIKAGETVLEIPDAISGILTFLKWAGIIGGVGAAAWLVHDLRKGSGSGSHRALEPDDDAGDDG